MASSGTLAMNPAHERKNQGAQHTNTWYVDGMPEDFALAGSQQGDTLAARLDGRSRMLRHQQHVLQTWHHAPTCWHDGGCSR
jgi:hypothetical protein